MRNVLAVAWSSDDGLLAMMTRAAWRGPKNQVHVLDVTKGFASLAKLDLEGDPDHPGCLTFSSEHLLGYVGRHASAWAPRTGERAYQAQVAGWLFALYPDGRAGVSTNGALHLQTLDNGDARRLGFSAARLTPIDGTEGDWAVVEDREIRRVSRSGDVRWTAPMLDPIHRMAAAPSSVVVAMNGVKSVHVHDAKTGEISARIPLKDQVGSVGIAPDGVVWILEWHGRLAFHRPTGELLREVTIDALVREATMSTNGTKLAIQHDLLELRSSLRVVDTVTGELLFESSARAKKAPSARGADVVLSAKDGKLWKKGQETPIGTYAGDVQLAVAKDGSQAIVRDDDGVRVFDTASGAQVLHLTHAKIEEETIDVVDRPLFDDRGRPCVEVGRHTFVVTKDGVTPAKTSKASRRAR